ncbi:hypothetical protein Tco_0111147 [Tanacetum coccineum]
MAMDGLDFTSMEKSLTKETQEEEAEDIDIRQGLICSLGHDARTIARAADRVEDVGYVRALQASEHRMMISIEEVNLRVIYQAPIDVVRGHRTAYETELHERQNAEDLAVRQMMHTQVLEARARIDTVEDAGSSC